MSQQTKMQKQQYGDSPNNFDQTHCVCDKCFRDADTFEQCERCKEMFIALEDGHLLLIVKERAMVRCTSCRVVFKYPHLLGKKVEKEEEIKLYEWM
jgi:hypothetical protein